MRERRIDVTQGEQAVAREAGVCISTLLGSCVACCLWDPVARVGGLNHMLMAGRLSNPTASELTGINEMELLVNGLIKQGAVRSRLVAKVFGGARMVKGLSNAGEMNGRFALDFLARERIPCVSQSLGGVNARHILFWPESGVAKQKFIRDVALPDVDFPADMTRVRDGNDVEFF